jgi:hypothetical protein
VIEKLNDTLFSEGKIVTKMILSSKPYSSKFSEQPKPKLEIFNFTKSPKVQCHHFEQQQLSALPPHLTCARVSAGFNASFTNAQTTPSASSSGQCSSGRPHMN